MRVKNMYPTQKFELGDIVNTNGIYEAIINNLDFLDDVNKSMKAYVEKDWGCMSEEDKQENERALVDGDQLMGAYETCLGKIWIITEWDRSVTTILFPNEY